MSMRFEPMITGLLVRLGLGTVADFDAASKVLDHDLWLSAIHDGLTELRDARERMLEMAASIDRHRASLHVRETQRAAYATRMHARIALGVRDREERAALMARDSKRRKKAKR